MRRKKIATQRLVLRPLAKADYATWFEAVTSGTKRPKFEPEPRTPRQCSRAAFDAVRARDGVRAREDSTYKFGVFLAQSRVLVGMVDVTVLQRRQLQVGNLGYRIFAPYRRNGYAREAVLATIHIAFDALKLNRLEAVIDPDNRPSLKLARSIGMVRECVRRKYYYQNGRFEDQVVWSAQREDYDHAPLVLPR